MRGRLWYMLLAVLLPAGGVYANRAPVVSNVRAQQRPGTLLVDITYDVNDADGDTLTISVEISADGGRTFRVPAHTFEGDVGPGITPGAGKRIIWNAGVDVPDTYGTDFRPKVIADDGQPPGGKVLAAQLPGGATMEFAWVAPGTFLMGSPATEPGREADEEPQHQVRISRGFYLGKFEITQAQWESVMGSNPSFFKGANHPVERISWLDVQGFIHQLNAAAGDSLYRLPTEAEWEYAARAGTGTRWSFGEDESKLRDHAWYAVNNNPEGTEEVGTKLPNPWGLFDMYGNLWEWCQDWYSSTYYSVSPGVDPPGPATGSFRVQRGGGFYDIARYLRSAERSRSKPAFSGYGLGARLLRIK